MFLLRSGPSMLNNNSHPNNEVNDCNSFVHLNYSFNYSFKKQLWAINTMPFIALQCILNRYRLNRLIFFCEPTILDEM